MNVCEDPRCSCRLPLPAYAEERLPCGEYVNAWDAAWALEVGPVCGGQDTTKTEHRA